MSATVTLVGIELQASNLGLPESSDWYAWNYERDLSATGGANSTLNSVEISTELGVVATSGTAFVATNGLQSTATASNLEANGDSLVAITGIGAQSSLGEVIATAVDPVSVSVSVTGLSLTSALGTVRAQVVNDQVVGSSGRPASYNVTIQNAKLNIQGIGTTILTSDINAVGTINISRVVSISTARLVAQPQAVTAVGILDISDEELITLLMAA